MTTTHWTERSSEDFLYSIASDFVEQLRAKMKRIGMSQSKLAKAAKVSKGYVSQVFNDPGNLSLVTIVKFAKAVGMKVSVVGYEEDPKRTGSGPINSEIFRLCWENAGKPADMWEVKTSAATTNAINVKPLAEGLSYGLDIFIRTFNDPPFELTRDLSREDVPIRIKNSKSTHLINRGIYAQALSQ